MAAASTAAYGGMSAMPPSPMSADGMVGGYGGGGYWHASRFTMGPGTAGRRRCSGRVGWAGAAIGAAAGGLLTNNGAPWPAGILPLSAVLLGRKMALPHSTRSGFASQGESPHFSRENANKGNSAWSYPKGLQLFCFTDLRSGPCVSRQMTPPISTDL